MATARQVLDGLRGQLATALASFIPTTLQLGTGWPPEVALQKVPQSGVAIGGVYDFGRAPMSKTRWPRLAAVPDTTVTPGTMVMQSRTLLLRGQTATLTIDGTPLEGDAVGVQAGAFATSYVALQGDGVNEVAAGLAAAINSDESLPISATVAGDVVTVTALTPCQLGTAIANTATRTTEYHRVRRLVRFILWAQSPAQRDAIGDIADQTLAQLQSNFGLALTNGEWVKVDYDDDLLIDDKQLADLYRRDFFTALEYGVTVTETLFPVVGTNTSISGSV